MKIGIVGGTFDPIHAAHCYLMEECRLVLDLDRLLVIPNGDPPHKGSTAASACHRLAMTRLALADYENLEVSDLEAADPQTSYTWKSLTKLKELHPQDALYFILGADSMISFQNWRRPDLILKLATLVCFDRPNYRAREVTDAVDLVREQGGQVIRIDSLELEISSTDIRARVAQGLPHRAFLHPRVYDYIHANGLYQAKPAVEEDRDRPKLKSADGNLSQTTRSEDEA